MGAFVRSVGAVVAGVVGHDQDLRTAGPGGERVRQSKRLGHVGRGRWRARCPR